MMKRKTVYVADDDANILELMDMIFQSRGYEVVLSSDGRSLATLHPLPDVAFLDIAMSGSDGSEICKAIKEAGIKIPVILVSANTNIDQIAQNSCADAYLPKPFDIKTILELAEAFTRSDRH